MSDTNQQRKVYGQLILRLSHANRDVIDLALKIGLPTARYWKPGDSVDCVVGSTSRKRSEYHWSADITLLDREFTEVISDVLSLLHRNESDVLPFTEMGGRVSIYVQLNGKLNVGDMLEPPLLAELARLQTSLDLEVFPDYGQHNLN